LARHLTPRTTPQQPTVDAAVARRQAMLRNQRALRERTLL
jgi:hypothetical protein